MRIQETLGLKSAGLSGPCDDQKPQWPSDGYAVNAGDRERQPRGRLVHAGR